MIQQNSRIENFNGIRFFEQDILYDDYIYDNYSELLLTIDYCSPGFGFVLFNGSDGKITTSSECYLFRFGNNEASVVYKSGFVQRVLSKIPIKFYDNTDFHNLKISFKKIDRLIYLSVNDMDIIVPKVFKLSYDINKYRIGIYSSAGNIIKEIKSMSYIPKFWDVNMRNTYGGRISFFDDGFKLSECKDKAEIEQSGILLKPGTYYLNYKNSSDSDIKCYVFKSNSTKTSDDAKNILDNDNSFTIKRSCKISIKFVGTHGVINNIILNSDTSSEYVSTSSDEVSSKPSSITVYLNNVESIKWTALISNIDDETSYLFKIQDSVIKCNFITDDKSYIGKTYTYKYDVESKIFSVEGNDFYKDIVLDIDNSDCVSLLYNTDAQIYSLILTTIDGESKNIIENSQNHIDNIPITRMSPIIITDKHDNPIDISSSYRIITTLSDAGTIDYSLDSYVFTNFEREIFPVSSNTYQLVSQIAHSAKSAVVYGIVSSSVDYDNFYRIQNNDIHDISLFCNNHYEIINNDIVEIDYASNSISINSSNIDRYKYIVIDYLKDNCYCINSILDKDNFYNSRYTVNISSSNDLLYYTYGSGGSEYRILNLNDIDSNNGSYYLCISKNSNTEGVSVL